MYALVLLAFLADTEPAPAMKVIARGSWGQSQVNTGELRTPKLLVIRKAEDLANLAPYNRLDALPGIVGKNATADLAKDLKVKDIDWSKQMVVIVLAGMKPSGGHGVEVTGVKVVKGVLKVSWKAIAPDGIATAVITFPSQAVLLPAFAGKVEADPPIGK
jgi:hypothetical protein